MLDLDYADHADLGEMGQDPGFRLGYEYPELLDALAELGAPMSAPTGDTELSDYDADAGGEGNSGHVQTQVFSIAQDERLIHALIMVAGELNAHVQLMSADQTDGAASSFWDAQAGADPDISGFPEAFQNLQAITEPYLEIASSGDCARKIRVMLG